MIYYFLPFMMPTITKKHKLNRTNSVKSGRQFKEWWTEMYGVTEYNEKSICVFCSGTVVCRTSLVKRHFETTHKDILNKSLEERKEYIAKAIKNACIQSSTLKSFTDRGSASIAASFEISKIIAKKGKPFSDGEYIKNAFIECASYLFEDFENTEEIVARIKTLKISRNTVKDRILKMSVDVTNQQRTDINLCDWISICLDECTDVTLSARLAVFVRYFVGNEIVEELISLVSLPKTTKGIDICNAVVEALLKVKIDLSKIVSVCTDGAPSMVGRTAGFINLFKESVGHSILAFHCIIHQEALCAKVGLESLKDVMKIVTKVVNLISAHPLSKRKFELLLKEVNSTYNGLLMYNSVRWLSRGKVLQRFVECLNEINQFLCNQQIVEYKELNNCNWISRLMFFTDICLHMNDLNMKLQGRGKIITAMYDNIKAFEIKLQIFKRDISTEKFKYFPNLKKHMMNSEINGDFNNINLIKDFEKSLDETIAQFSQRFDQFRRIEETTKFIICPDTCEFSRLNLEIFEFMELYDFEMQLVDFQSSSIWPQKFKELRNNLEVIDNVKPDQKNAENQLLALWQSIPDTFSCLKNVAMGILTIFSSTYSCESLFSSMNFIKSDLRSTLTDESSTACITLKTTHYEPDIKKLSFLFQQKEKK